MKSRSFLTLAVLLLASATIAVAQQKPDVTTITAKLGPCSADFTVTDDETKPVYDATIHVRVRYGAFNLKRMDLEVGTSSAGKARIESLPSKAKPLMYEISKGEKHATKEQDVATMCNATYDVMLK